MKAEILYTIITVACILNILVSVLIFRREDLESFQKAAQIIIIWLLPLIGAIGLWLFHRSNDSDTPTGGPFGGGSSNNDASGAD